ncbi:MAG TPA: hypothetical protein VN376_09440 [Longilinea sp.]|nr:hypothetical protein [Longilinea sp.]
MKHTLTILAVLAILMSVLGVSPVQAENLHQQTWNSAIVVMNPHDVSADFLITYYDSTGIVIASTSLFTLAPMESRTILVGSLANDGSAVISSNTDLVAVYREVLSNNSSSPSIYTAFAGTPAGSSTVYIPSFVHNATTNTLVSVQSLEGSADVTLTMTFYDASGTATVLTLGAMETVHPSSPQFFDANLFTGQLTSTFSGSLVITAADSRQIAAVAEQTTSSGRSIFSAEGVPAGADTVYLPSAMCGYGRYAQHSEFIVMNTSATAGTFTIHYYDAQGNQAFTLPSGWTSDSVPAYSSVTINPCSVSPALPSGTLYTAVITANTGQYAAIGQVLSNNGLQTAHAGVSSVLSTCSGGSCWTVLPYVEWSSSIYAIRTYIALMNVGTTTASSVNINYYQANGTLLGTQTVSSIPQYAKVNSNPSLATGVITQTRRSFLGSVVVVSDQPLLAIARVQRLVRNSSSSYTTLGEDYLGYPYIP